MSRSQRRHRYVEGRCVCGAQKPTVRQAITPCPRPKPTTEERAARGRAIGKAWRTRAALNGTCHDCLDAALPGFSHCAKHREKMRARERTRALRAGRAPQLWCPCGVAGHYEHACPTGGARAA